MGYQVDDLTIDLAPRRVRRAGTVIPLKALSFDLLVTLVRAAPNLVSFEQLAERVWPGLVVSPETVVQRVKLLRDALDDDSHTPRYIEGVRGRGYRMVAKVRSLMTEPDSPNVHARIAATEAVGASSPSVTPPAAPRPAKWVPLGWVGGALVAVALLAAFWAIVHYRGASEPGERTSSEAAPAAIHSLAVLPLENLSDDKEQEYFADGMTDTLTTDLAQIGSLRVVSRTSAMHFKGTKEPLSQIGQELKVDAVVEGTVARSANRVRITAQLVAPGSDQHLWAKAYERDLKDVLVLQDEIAQDITEQIRVKLTPKERSLFIQVHPVDPEAYDAYLRGLYWGSKGNADTWKGLDYFQKAIAREPSYARAYAGVAEAYIGLGGGGFLSIREAYPKAREAALKALELDPSLSEAHSSLASMKLQLDSNWPGAMDEIRTAVALDPNNASAHARYSRYLLATGRFDDALKELERARVLDPFSFPLNIQVGVTLFTARRYDDALRQFRQSLEIFPDRYEIYNAMADVYEHQKMFAEAFTARQQALSMQNDPAVAALAEAYQRSGYRGWLLKKIEMLKQAPAQAVLTEKRESHLDPFREFGFAYFYGLMNDADHAVPHLERAYEGSNPGVLYLQVDPRWDSIRSSPRFRDLVRRIGLPEPVNK